MDFKPEKGIKEEPDFLVVYGQAGLGKTTFASQAPKPLFIDPRSGSKQLDVERLQPKTWNEYVEMIKWSIPKDYKSIVLDEMNFIDQMAQTYIWEKYYQDKGTSFATLKLNGSNYNVLNEMYKTEFLPLLDSIIASGKNLIIVAHPEVKDMADPLTAENYIRYQLGLSNGLNQMLKRACHNLFFINKDVFIVGEKDNKRVIADDKIYIFTQFHQAYDAKQRFDLPSKIELEKGKDMWKVFQGLKKVETEAGIISQIEGYIPMFPKRDGSGKQGTTREGIAEQLKKNLSLDELRNLRTNLQGAVK